MTAWLLAFVFQLTWSNADAEGRARGEAFDPVAVTAAIVPAAHALPRPGVTDLTVSLSDPAAGSYNPLQTMLDEEAHLALASGDYSRAWQYFWRLVLIDPFDLRALRECGRLAHAMGRFKYAVETLGRVDAIDGDQPDPELHYLRGESLLALGRKPEAERELARAERELGPEPAERRAKLWLARIAALRGDSARALAIYQTLRDDTDPAADVEIQISMAEVHTLAKDWRRAERRLRSILAEHPDHGRVREILAWVLENRGELDEALTLRAGISASEGAKPATTVEYARALERAANYPEALGRYRAAERLGEPEVATDISRLERLLGPEISGGMTRRDDPSGAVDGWMVGASVPIAGSLRVAVTGARETTSGGLPQLGERTATLGSVMALANGRRGGVIGVGATAYELDAESALGGSAVVRTQPGHHIQLHLRGDIEMPWRESASTIREGGTYSGVSAQVFAAPWTRALLFSGGLQTRQLALSERAASVVPGSAMDGARADQMLGFGGVDVVAWHRPERVARGELFDDDMLVPRTLSSSWVLSYRHYETSSDDPFGSRLVLIGRSSSDEVSSVVRHVLDRRGMVAAEARGGLGYDWRRDVRSWRTGASLLLSATAWSRLGFEYDFASESGTGLVGHRHAGSMVLHVDL